MPLYFRRSSKSVGGETDAFTVASPEEAANLTEAVYQCYKDIATEFSSQPPTHFTKDSHRLLYVCQNEVAVVHPDDDHVQWIGAGDATTCHLVVLRHKGSGITLLSHVDNRVDAVMIAGFMRKMRDALQHFAHFSVEFSFDLWLVGGFDDERRHSKAISATLLNQFNKFAYEIHLQFACITNLNTEVDSQGMKRPRVTDVAVSVQFGDVRPAKFDAANKGPDLPLRMNIGREKLSGIYDYKEKCLSIGPFHYVLIGDADRLLQMSDEWFLQNLSTSPSCEPADFVARMRASIEFARDNPNAAAFFGGKARRFRRRTTDGQWERKFDD